MVEGVENGQYNTVIVTVIVYRLFFNDIVVYMQYCYQVGTGPQVISDIEECLLDDNGLPLVIEQFWVTEIKYYELEHVENILGKLLL